MVAINFPDSPTNGQEHAGYVWDATNNVWNRLPTLPALDLVNFSAVAPSNPQDGQFWFDTTVGKMYVYYNDGSSSQWVSAIGGLASQTGTTGQVLTYDGTEWVADDLPASGKILQVVSVSVTNTFTTTSSSFVERTGLSVSITPSSTSSKIFAQLVHGGVESTSGYSATQANIYAGGVDIGAPISSVYFANGGDRAPVSVDYLHSPNTTSAITYAAYVSASSGTGSFRRGTLTLMEVAG